MSGGEGRLTRVVGYLDILRVASPVCPVLCYVQTGSKSQEEIQSDQASETSVSRERPSRSHWVDGTGVARS